MKQPRVFVITDGEYFKMFSGRRRSRWLKLKKGEPANGNPYLVYGKFIHLWLGIKGIGTIITVATITSGYSVRRMM